MRSNMEYTLDFVIPAGPTGPMGPTGVTNLCFIKFADSSNVGNMSIDTNIILPTNTSSYTVTSNTVTINETGYYEITFCGKIDRNPANKRIDVNLMSTISGVTTEMSGMSGQWFAESSQVIHFSQTSIYQFENPITFSVSIAINGTTAFNVSSVNLLIKKLPF